MHPSGANPCPRSTSISFFGQFYYDVAACACARSHYYCYDIYDFGCHISLLHKIDVCVCPDLRRRRHRCRRMMANGHLCQNKSDDVVTHFNILLFGFISFRFICPINLRLSWRATGNAILFSLTHSLSLFAYNIWIAITVATIQFPITVRFEGRTMCVCIKKSMCVLRCVLHLCRIVRIYYI